MELEIDKMYSWWCPFCGAFEDYPLVHHPEYSICPTCGRLVSQFDKGDGEDTAM